MEILLRCCSLEIVFDLVFVQFCWLAAEMQSHGPLVDGCSYQRYVTSAEMDMLRQTLQQFCKSIN